MTAYAARFCRNLRELRPKLSIQLGLFEEGFSFSLFGLWISLPFLNRWAYEPHEIMESWGLSYFERTIHCNWGRHCKIIHLPWDYDHMSHEVRRPDGTWVPFVGSWEVGQGIKNTNGVVVIKGGKEPDGRWEAKYPYHYLLLPSGEVQHATATIYVERREWRQKWLWWCPLFAKRRQSISVEFDREMGSEAGSWKGGVMGTGYEMRPNETPEETLRRMQREHRFDRC